MDLFERLIENPLFFRWIYQPSDEINFYWEHYLKIHPEHSNQILQLKEKFEEHLRIEPKKLTEREKKDLAKRILLELNIREHKKKRQKLIQNTLRYAAVALLFFFIGSSSVFLYLKSRQPEQTYKVSRLSAPLNEPVLIMGEDEEVKLNQGKSELQYSTEGKVTINNEREISKGSGSETPVMNTLLIPYGNRSEIVLSDGSKVWLNAGSRLIYPSRFVDKAREIFLTGEAFFEIKEDKNKPFIVKTLDVKVEVIGTQFNVSAYPEDYSVQTVLTEGSVKIKRTNAGIFEKAMLLEPGQLAYYSKETQETNIYRVNTEYYVSWRDGLFSFSKTNFNRVIKKLERYYNIQFQFDDPMKGNVQITGKLDVSKEREEIFEYLSKLTGFEFKRISNNRYEIK